MRKYLIFFIIFLMKIGASFAGAHLECSELIGCSSDGGDGDAQLSVIGEFIGNMILYTAVIAVLSLMISGIFYIISFGEEEKTKKAKKWIMWSLIGVVVSVSSWLIINSINNIDINSV